MLDFGNIDMTVRNLHNIDNTCIVIEDAVLEALVPEETRDELAERGQNVARVEEEHVKKRSFQFLTATSAAARFVCGVIILKDSSFEDDTGNDVVEVQSSSC